MSNRHRRVCRILSHGARLHVMSAGYRRSLSPAAGGPVRPRPARQHATGPRVIRPVARRAADTPIADPGGYAGTSVPDKFDLNRFPAPPGRAPTADEIDAIARAVFASPLVALVPPGRLQVTSIRISTGPPDWAFAALLPRDIDLDPAVAVLRFDVSGGWVLDQVGTAEVGVGRFPALGADASDHGGW